MLKGFEMIQHKFQENNDIHIVPISDVHLCAAELEAIRRVLREDAQ